MSDRKILGAAVIGLLLGLLDQALAQDQAAPAQTGPLLAQQSIDKEMLGTPAAPQGQFDLRLALPQKVRVSKGHRHWREPLGELLPSTALPAVQMPPPGQAAPSMPDVQKVPSMVAPAPAPAAPAAPRPQQTAPGIKDQTQ